MDTNSKSFAPNTVYQDWINPNIMYFPGNFTVKIATTMNFIYCAVFHMFQGVSIHFEADDYDVGLFGNDPIDDIKLNLTSITSQDVQLIDYTDHPHGPNNSIEMR